jgi:hypothetical protein
MPRWLRFGWSKVDARLIDRKFVRRDSYNVERGGHYQVWDYMVELPDPRKRLVIREKTFKVDVPENGEPVPVLVNRRRTRAVFDLDDPRIDAVGRLKAKQERRRERDEQRFDDKLGA